MNDGKWMAGIARVMDGWLDGMGLFMKTRGEYELNEWMDGWGSFWDRRHGCADRQTDSMAWNELMEFFSSIQDNCFCTCARTYYLCCEV